MMAWQNVIPIKGKRHLIWYDNSEYWALALKLNQNNAEFHYSATLWENTIELNENDFSLTSSANNKYWAYSNLPADKFIVEIGGVQRIFTLKTAYKGKTLLQLQQYPLNDGGSVRGPEAKFDTPKGFYGTKTSLFASIHTGTDDIVHITEPFFGKATATPYMWARLGGITNQSIGSLDSGSGHGMGLYMYYTSGNNGNLGCGHLYWVNATSNVRTHYKGLIWVKIDKSLLRKLGVSDQGKIKIPLPPPRCISRASDTSCYSERRAA